MEEEGGGEMKMAPQGRMNRNVLAGAIQRPTAGTQRTRRSMLLERALHRPAHSRAKSLAVRLLSEGDAERAPAFAGAMRWGQLAVVWPGCLHK